MLLQSRNLKFKCIYLLCKTSKFCFLPIARKVLIFLELILNVQAIFFAFLHFSFSPFPVFIKLFSLTFPCCLESTLKDDHFIENRNCVVWQICAELFLEMYRLWTRLKMEIVCVLLCEYGCRFSRKWYLLSDVYWISTIGGLIET